ncbi:MAG TPA: tripartite tricarboxylate transporter substrate-binding protein, partial [Methylibium sp.]|nr:tripartite tricarboxylate transporter substrate-binding protein [Methylibium sp.]
AGHHGHGRLAVDAVRSAAADGSALLVTPGSVLTMYPHIYRPINYDVFADLAPVAMVASTEFCLAVGPAVPATVQSVADFAAWCRANPAQANCGNAGAGSFPHFMALLMARETGIRLNHVPYRGGSAAMLALTGGQVASALATEGAALALEQAGKLRVLATTAAQRSVFFPKAPNFASLGYPLLAQREWFAVVAPAQAAASLQDALAEEVRAMLMEADAREAWARLGLVATSSSPAEIRAALRKEYDFWGPLIKASSFTPET